MVQTMMYVFHALRLARLAAQAALHEEAAAGRLMGYSGGATLGTVKEALLRWRCVCVNSTSGGEETLATPAYQGWLACVPLPLGAAVNKIKGATLTPPNAQARALHVSASPAPGNRVQLVLDSVA
jgi:hypothetical protein